MTEFDETPVTYRRALRVTALEGLSSLLIALCALLAVILAGLAVDEWAIPLLAAAMAGEQLWRQRADVPKEVPRLEIEPVELDDGPVGPWRMLAQWLGVSAVLFGAGLALGSGNVVLGFGFGFVLRDLIRMLRVVAWERRHGRRLVWKDGEGGVRPGVLVRA